MSDNIASHALTRRQFLKTTAATAALVAVGDKLFGGRTSALVENAEAAKAAGQDEWLHSYCRMCVQPRCPTLVHVKDGVVVEIQGDPKSPTNAGTLCPRGLAAIYNLYNPYRVKAPMKRTNPNKGLDVDPRWVEISWDEALNTVADRLKKIKAEDPRKLVVNTGFGSQRDYHTQILAGMLQQLGTPAANSFPTNGPLCSTHIAQFMTQSVMTNGPDIYYGKYLITVGSSMGATWATAQGPVRGLMDAIERGLKLVVVDPRGSKETTIGEWVPVRPGGELAFELSMINVMIYEIGLSKLDVTFLKRRSNAPYLIGAGERYFRDTASKKPMIWDPSDGKAKVFDDPSIKDYALEGEFTVGGQTLNPAYELIKREVKSNTPEWAESITSIPAATARRVANEFVTAASVGSTVTLDGMEFPLRPACIWPKRGALSQMDGAYVNFAAKVINMLVGAMDVPGGDQGNTFGPVLKPNDDGVVAPSGEAVGWPFAFPPQDVQLSCFYPLRHYTPYVGWRAIIDPKKYYLPYDVDTILVYGGNSLINNAAPDEPLQAFKKVPFVASIAYHYDEPAELSDILLPENSNLEREMFINVDPDSKGRWAPYVPSGITYRFPVVPLVYNTKSGDEILLELARRVGILTGEKGLNWTLNTSLRLKPELALQTDKVYTVSEIIDRELKSQFGADKGVDYWKNVGWQLDLLGPKQYFNYASFPMGKTRYAIFFEHLKEVGDILKAGCQKAGISVPGWDMADLLDHYRPIPHWRAMFIHKQPAEYDMYFVNWKTPFVLFGSGATVENPWLNEIAKATDPYQMVLCMNPATAAKKGLHEGDMVQVSSQWGTLTGRIKLSGLFHPEVIGTPGNYGRRSMHMNPIAREGPNYNLLLSPDDGTFDPVNAALAISPRVKVQKV